MHPQEQQDNNVQQPVQSTPTPPPSMFTPQQPVAALTPPPAKSNKTVLIVLAVIFGFLVFIGAIILAVSNMNGLRQQQATKNIGAITLQVYRNEAERIELKIPQTWKVSFDDDAGKGLSLYLNVRPPEGGDTELVSVVCNASREMTKESFVKAVEEGVIADNERKGETVSDKRQVQINGVDAYQFKDEVIVDLGGSDMRDAKVATYYHTYYMTSKTEYCSLYVLVTKSAGGTQLRPVESKADEIAHSFKRL